MTLDQEKNRRPNRHESSSTARPNRSLLPVLGVCMVLVIALCTATFLWRPVASKTTEMIAEAESHDTAAAASGAAGNSPGESTLVSLRTPHATMRSRAVQAGLDPRDLLLPDTLQIMRAHTRAATNSMADELELPRPKAVTTVKPSGTLYLCA